MKYKKMIIIFVCVLALCFTLGASGLIDLTDDEAGVPSANDRLIGVFVTLEPLDLFDFEAYFNDNANKLASGGEVTIGGAAYQGRLYAATVEQPYTNEETGETVLKKEYVFEGVEGISYFSALYTDAEGRYYGSSGDEAISDGHMEISSADGGESISLEGTVYASTTGGATQFFFNPVYQTAGGEVYATTGQGMSYGGDITAGMSGSYNMSEKSALTVDGETKEGGAYVEVTVCFIDDPAGVTVIQLDGESAVLLRTEYAPGELPEDLTAEEGAEYIVVETASTGAGGVTRELYQPDDATLSAFCCRDDGICVKQSCNIEW